MSRILGIVETVSPLCIHEEVREEFLGDLWELYDSLCLESPFKRTLLILARFLSMAFVSIFMDFESEHSTLVEDDNSLLEIRYLDSNSILFLASYCSSRVDNDIPGYSKVNYFDLERPSSIDQCQWIQLLIDQNTHYWAREADKLIEKSISSSVDRFFSVRNCCICSGSGGIRKNS